VNMNRAEEGGRRGGGGEGERGGLPVLASVNS